MDFWAASTVTLIDVGGGAGWVEDGAGGGGGVVASVGSVDDGVAEVGAAMMMMLWSRQALCNSAGPFPCRRCCLSYPSRVVGCRATAAHHRIANFT